MPLSCEYLGKLLTGPEKTAMKLSSSRRYSLCLNPDQPHGPAVCSCIKNTCGVSCTGYKNSTGSGGIVIGCYSEPERSMLGIIELQLRVIRANCGNAPVLLSVDQCPHLGHLEALADRFDDVSVKLVNQNRIGHAGGDLGAFYHGFQWCEERGLKYLAKLSQRYIIDRKEWLNEACKRDVITLTNRCREGGVRLPIRTEAMVMRVKDWMVALPKLEPRPIYPYSTEGLIGEIMKQTNLNTIHAWNCLSGADRCRMIPDIYWKCANPLEHYEVLAKKYGVDLGATWKFGGWPKHCQSDWG